ncbi:MAG: acyl-CoA thioesterase [Acidimicrobiia bacterium]
MPFRHSIAVRYGEVDMQKVVFNAHYLAYCDDAVETWFRGLSLSLADHDYDFMLKKAVVEWSGSAGVGDVLDIDVHVERWGNTSFDVAFAGSVRGERVFDCVITYVGVRAGTKETTTPPPAFREALGG